MLHDYFREKKVLQFLFSHQQDPRTWQLTTPLHVTPLCRAFTSRKIDPVTNFPLARHFFTKKCGPAIPVRLVAFDHRLNRKPWSWFPPFSLCTYEGHLVFLACSRATRRQKSTEIVLSNYRGPSSSSKAKYLQFLFSYSLACLRKTQIFALCKNFHKGPFANQVGESFWSQLL